MAHDDEDEEYYDESAEVLSSVARWVPFTVVFIALGGFLLLGWYAYQAGTQSVSEDELLVVEADDTPIKEKPADPGGMQFPNKDKMIFETFSSSSEDPPKVERLMPEPEEPVALPAAEPATTTWVNEEAKEKAAQSQEVAKEVKEDFVKVAAMDKDSAPVREKEVDSFRKEPESKPAPAAVAGGDMMIQLGAYRSQSEADAGWKKIKDKYSSLLGGYSHKVVRADLGAKGVYYRLRVPGFATMDSAKAFCDKLSAKGQACMAIKQ